MEFCSPFDEALAHTGPAAIFVPDQEGLLRFAPSWTRDAWGRAPGPHTPGWTWLLARDAGSGFVQLVLVSSPTLLVEHPRLDLRAYASGAAAVEARALWGSPPVAEAPW